MTRPRSVTLTTELPASQAILSAADLRDAAKRYAGWVSPWSKWTDDRWFLADPSRPGHYYGVANWGFEMPGGGLFTDARYVDIREAARIAIYALARFPSMRAKLKPQTVNEASLGFRYFAWWMVAYGLSSLAQVSHRMLEVYEDYLVADKLNEDLDDVLTSSSIARYLRPPFMLWEERSHIEAAGLPTLPGLPYPGETYNTVATRLTKAALGSIRPIPKEILVPLLNKAEWFLDVPARDVIEMTQFLAGEAPELLEVERSRAARAQVGRYLARKVRFSPDRDARPWHGNLMEERERIGVKELKPKVESSVELARDLMLDLMASASIVVQGSTGLRIGEIEALEARELNSTTGYPDCIDVRVDDTGSIELFYLKGWLIKSTAGREPADWLIGSRAVGTDFLPPPVLAVQRAFELSRILDRKAASGRLFVGAAPSGIWALLSGEASALDRSQLQNLQRAFAANYVDRALLDNPELLRTHGWRKSFAQFVFGVDPTLAAALSQHFKHLSIAMTMEAYVTNDAALLGYLESERAMETARDLYEIATGKTAPAGRLGRDIQRHAEEIRAMVKGMEESKAIKRIYAYVSENQIVLWFLEWGACGIMLAPSEAACHAEAGTPSWRNVAPSFGYRDLDVCAGCSRLLILRRHADFWEERYRRLREAWDNHDDELGLVFRAALRKKVAQARAVLRALEEPARDPGAIGEEQS